MRPACQSGRGKRRFASAQGAVAQYRGSILERDRAGGRAAPGSHRRYRSRKRHRLTEHRRIGRRYYGRLRRSLVDSLRQNSRGTCVEIHVAVVGNSDRMRAWG